MRTFKVITPLLFLVRIFLAMSVTTLTIASSNIEQGDVALKNRDISKAIQYYQIELKNNPESVIARTKLAKCYMDKGYKTAATKMIDEAITLIPNDIDALLLKGKLHLWNGQNNEAKEVFHRVQNLSPDNIEAHYYLSGIYIDKGDTKTADELYLKIKTLKANN